MAASNPWRPTIANAGLIERLMWDIVWDIPTHRVPNPTSRQAIGLLVVNPASSADLERWRTDSRFVAGLRQAICHVENWPEAGV